MKLLVLSVLIVLLTAGHAFAQPEPGDIGVFSDPAGTMTSGPVPPGLIFNLYLVAFDVGTDGLIWGFEAGIITSTPVGLYIVLSEISFWADIDPNQLSWATGFQAPFPGVGAVVLADILILDLIGLPDTFYCVAPSIMTSQLGYFETSGTLIPFGIAEYGAPPYPDGCWIGNPLDEPPIASEPTSWGTMKAIYR